MFSSLHFHRYPTLANVLLHFAMFRNVWFLTYISHRYPKMHRVPFLHCCPLLAHDAFLTFPSLPAVGTRSPSSFSHPYSHLAYDPFFSSSQRFLNLTRGHCLKSLPALAHNLFCMSHRNLHLALGTWHSLTFRIFTLILAYDPFLAVCIVTLIWHTVPFM